jgi:hypothetical protein
VIIQKIYQNIAGYQAGSRDKPRRIVVKIEKSVGERRLIITKSKKLPVCSILIQYGV